MDDFSGTAANVVRAVAAAVDWTSSPDARKASLSYLASIKDGDIRVLAGTSFLLVKKDQSSEIRLHGFKMLQHLVRMRWDEFSIVERGNFANAALNLVAEMVAPCEEWALRSQTAALVAEVVRREGLHLWQEILPSLTSISRRGPVEGELVAMILRWLPEDITVHNEDLEGDRRGELLRGLTQSLPELLPLLYNLLESHFGAALEHAGRQNFDQAKVHAATVTAVLNALNAYAEWAPVPDLARYHLIQGCSFLLSSIEFRLHAIEFFKLLSQRKRPADDSATEFDSALTSIFNILITISIDFFKRSSANAAAINGSEFEFIERICESMVSLGQLSLQYVASDGNTLYLYLQQMLRYFQHFKLAFHFQSLQFWLSIMKEISSKGKVVQSSGESLGDERKVMVSLINDDFCGEILDVSFQRLIKKPVFPASASFPGPLESWSDDFDGKNDFSNYKSRLLDLIRYVTTYKPIIAISNICQKITSVMEGCNQDLTSQVLPLLEGMHLGLETVISASFDGSLEATGCIKEPSFEFGMLEGLLQRLLSLNWKEPALVEVQGRYLDAFGPYLKCFPGSVGGVVSKLFKMLGSLPCVPKGPSGDARHGRFQVCTSFIRIAKAAGRSLLPHMRIIADTMDLLEAEGCLLRGERNLLSEAFLIVGSSVSIEQHQEVLTWLLEPLSRQWTQLDWQNTFLSEPLGLARLCSDTQLMWSIFHCVSFFEKALKRSGMKKHVGTQNASITVQNPTSPMNPIIPHFSWMLPPLLKLLRCIHSLWSNQIIPTLPTELRTAMSMSEADQASLLGEMASNITKPHISNASRNDANVAGPSVTTENDVRNWLKGIRDSGYSIIGMSATIGEQFFRCLDSADVAVALMENVQWMEFRHIRQLVHLAIIPLVKFCPLDLWGMWIEKLLHPLFIHCQQALSCSWSSLLQEGRAKVPDMFSNLAGWNLKLEMMEEKLLRALSREICLLLSVAASPPLNTGIPSLDQLGNSQRAEVSSLKNLDTFASNSLTCFFLMHKELAVPALQIALQAFTWTDWEAVSKVAFFCGVVTLLAISSNNLELCEFVARDLFFAIVQSLTLESNATISSELLGLCREIFFYLSSRDPAPKQVILSIPGISSSDLLAFEHALGETSSPKEQKQHMKSLFQLATGNKFRALAAHKTSNIITNVSTKPRGLTSVTGPNNSEDEELEGLAAIT